MTPRGQRRAPDAEWVLMYRHGLSRTKIAELSGAPARTVTYHLKAALAMDPDLAAEHEAADPHNAAGVRVRGIERMNELITMVQSTRRYPSSKAAEASERSLAAWLRHRRLEAKAGTLARAFRDGLDVLPDWQGVPRAAADEARWQERLNALAAYRESGQDWPRHKATDTAEEHGLGVWLHTQRYKLSRGDLDPTKKQALDGAVPGWSAGRTRGRKPPDGKQTRQAGPTGATLIL